ncbi:MAG: DUF2829 domain-containing protein [Muribaculaceae bacterium]|nr:DUF2829 domain-containing protein [Muribaculaceae bacterium]
MKQYIRTEVVKAEPMTYGEAYKSGLIPENPCACVEEYDDSLGYLVTHMDGFKDWSPKEVFELKYKAVEGMTFGLAIKALKAGSIVRRTGWDCLSLVVIKQIPAHITDEIIPKMQSLPEAAKRLVLQNAAFVDYTDQCLIYNKDTGEANSWVPTISDVFAEDWIIVEQ